jgi:SPP1 gp7 family putative phage head morphogenesis protein
MTTPVSDEVADRIIRHMLNLERFKSHEGAKVVRMMREHVVPGLTERLERRLKWIATRGVDKGVHSTKRLRDLVQFSRDYVKAGARRLYNELSGDMKALAVQEAGFTADALKTAVPEQLPLEFVRPPNNLLRSIVTSQPMQGRIMRDWFDKIASNTQDAIIRELNVGIAGGETVPQMMRRVREATGMMTRQATTIVRTATNHVSNAARHATYEENSDVVKGWKFSATLDTRTTPTCMAEDGKVYALGKGQKPPLHYNCRSTTVPVLKSWEELGIDAKEAPEGTRASMGGQVPRNLTYGKWLKTQTEAVQIEALGRKRAKLFRQGKVTVKGLVNRQGKPLTLKQLEAKGKRITKTAPKPKAPKVPTPPKEPPVQSASEMLKNINMADVEQRNREWVEARDRFETASFNKPGQRREYRAKMYRAQDRLDEAKAGMRRKLEKALQLPEAQRAGGMEIDFQKAGVTPPMKRNVQSVVEWLKSITAKKALPGGRIPGVRVEKFKDRGRAFYTGNKAKFDASELKKSPAPLTGKVDSTIAHEFGHHMESVLYGSAPTPFETKPGVRKAVQFVLRRAKAAGSKIRQMKDWGTTYDADELTLEDKFKHPYTGKLYSWKKKLKVGMPAEDVDFKDQSATEAISMGVERLYKDPMQFLLEDRDFFEFTVNFLRGLA